jgi:hypothetical protein
VPPFAVSAWNVASGQPAPHHDLTAAEQQEARCRPETKYRVSSPASIAVRGGEAPDHEPRRAAGAPSQVISAIRGV